VIVAEPAEEGLMTTLITGGSLIQSSFGSTGAHNLEAVVTRPRPEVGQEDWRYCAKCQILFFDGFQIKGVCPAGGGHLAESFNLVLPHDVPGSGPSRVAILLQMPKHVLQWLRLERPLPSRRSS